MNISKEIRDAVILAVRNQNIQELFPYLKDHLKQIQRTAIQESSIPVLQWLQTFGHPVSDDVCFAAAAKGDLELFRWASSEVPKSRRGWMRRAILVALQKGRLPILKFMHEIRMIYPSKNPNPYYGACTTSVEYQQLDCLKWFHEAGYSWTAITFNSAIQMENLDILQYLYDQGCPRSIHACAQACDLGKLKSLKFLISKGVPWDPVECMKFIRPDSETHRFVLRHVRARFKQALVKVPPDRETGCVICKGDFKPGRPAYKPLFCACNYASHKKCMFLWFDTKFSCPMCSTSCVCVPA